MKLETVWLEQYTIRLIERRNWLKREIELHDEARVKTANRKEVAQKMFLEVKELQNRAEAQRREAKQQDCGHLPPRSDRKTSARAHPYHRPAHPESSSSVGFARAIWRRRP